MKRISTIFIVMLTLIGCEKPLNEEVYSKLGPSNFYKTTEDAEVLLNSAYAASQGLGNLERNMLAFGELQTDILIERQGGIFIQCQPIEDFKIDATHAWLASQWQRYYEAIFRSNTVIDHVPSIDMNEERRDQIVAEARFLRALNYFWLYNYWGPVPLITTSNTTPQDRPSRPIKEDFINFMEDEFIACAEVLPVTQDEFPRATKGAALGFLAKLYLNEKKWTEAAAAAKQVMDLGIYDIFIGTNSRTELFDLANEQCSEFIFVIPYSTKTMVNGYTSHAAPPNFQFKYPPHTNYAAQLRIRTEFINTFDPNDQRLEAFMFSYTNTNGETVVLGTDNARSWKYPEDPNGVGSGQSNDFPLLRYADILLTRAEALNEISGPTQEALDLIKPVRNAAGLGDLLLADFPDKASLRDHILNERGWEFHTEALRRQDLIRHGKLIEWALARGKTEAKDYHVLYPIPDREIKANENLEQNPGYE